MLLYTVAYTPGRGFAISRRAGAHEPTEYFGRARRWGERETPLFYSHLQTLLIEAGIPTDEVLALRVQR